MPSKQSWSYFIVFPDKDGKINSLTEIRGISDGMVKQGFADIRSPGFLRILKCFILSNICPKNLRCTCLLRLYIMHDKPVLIINRISWLQIHFILVILVCRVLP